MIKKILSAAAALLLLLSMPIHALAAQPTPKEEVVYGLLKPDGSLESLYVVNIFDGGEITDYGNYDKVINLTDSQKISQSGDEITVSSSAKRLYYQGNLSGRELPWEIAIAYTLDGKEISGDELAGKSGKLEIALTVKENTAVTGGFFDSYALQISMGLDTKLCSNILAPGATLAEAGRKKQISYTVLPGDGLDATVSADVQAFEMDAIQINGIKLTFGLSLDTDAFTGQLSQLTDAIKELDDGSGELLDGATRLSDGMAQYISGLKAYNVGAAQLPAGTEQLSQGAAALSGGLSALTKQSDTLVNGALALQGSAFDAVNAQLSGKGLPVLTPENYAAVLGDIPDLAAVKAQLDSAVQFAAGLQSYTGGVAQLEQGAKELSGGAAQLSASSSQLAASANALYNAGAELNAAIRQLRDGLSAYHEGTSELRSRTSGMDTEISSTVDDLLGSISGEGGETVSFVSEKNTTVSSVQFVLKTASVEIPEEETPVSQPAEQSFWQKLLGLFGLNK